MLSSHTSPLDENEIDLDEWTSMKDSCDISCDPFAWKKLFYFGQFFANKTGEFSIDSKILRKICLCLQDEDMHDHSSNQQDIEN